MRAAILVFALATTAPAQWTLQDSGTTADLRGIASAGPGIAWASGTNGTVLRTEDGGYLWQHCTTPPGAEKLDFRGIQAFDNNTAIVMSSGKGDLSRLYKTTDGCQTWKLVATNPDKDGFWDAIQAETPIHVYVLGDAVGEDQRLWEWATDKDPSLDLSWEARHKAESNEGSFAASNSVLELVRTPQSNPVWMDKLRWTSGTAKQSFMNIVRMEVSSPCEPCREEFARVNLPMDQGVSSAGVFSFTFSDDMHGVAAGGNYLKPNDPNRTASFTTDGGKNWQSAKTSPHGYRSAVAYDEKSKTWITVGPNGTDISTDDGRNWRALKPSPGEAPDADQHWNALSLPFVVGPHGRIGIFNPQALKAQ